MTELAALANSASSTLAADILTWAFVAVCLAAGR
jgi:hypothetical protein